jgi:hypothetical protein
VLCAISDEHNLSSGCNEEHLLSMHRIAHPDNRMTRFLNGFDMVCEIIVDLQKCSKMESVSEITKFSDDNVPSRRRNELSE